MTLQAHRHVMTVTLAEQLDTPPVLGVEVGVWRGKLSAYLLHQFPSLNLIMIDPWAETDDPVYAGQPFEEAKKIALKATDFARDRRIVMSTTSLIAADLFSTAWETGEGRIKGLFDFVFLDGSHHYKSVVADLKAWFPLVRAGGILSGHDYVRQRRGVHQAVDEFAEVHGRDLHLDGGRVWWFHA